MGWSSKIYYVLKCNFCMNKDIDFGPVVTKEAQNKILGLVDKGVEQGASLKVDGRNFKIYKGT